MVEGTLQGRLCAKSRRGPVNRQLVIGGARSKKLAEVKDGFCLPVCKELISKR